MTAVHRSRVWPCWDNVYDTLSGLVWPPHPLTGKIPPVVYSGSRDVAMEMITVPGMKLPLEPTADYAVLGVVGRDEKFTLIVHLFSEVPGFTDPTLGGDPSRAVRARLRVLTELVEETFRDPVTGRPAGISVPGVLWHEVTGIIPAVGVIERGYGASATIEITFTARI